MATNTEEDPDLESLRSAVLASLKTKSTAEHKSEAEESSSERTDEERNKDDKTDDMLEEEEEDLHALRLAALKTKRDDGLPKEPKTAPTTFERQGNLISIQIVDPEEEKRKAEAERIAKAKAMAAAKAEVGKAAKPARFRRVESSDSENDEEEEEEEVENGSHRENLSGDEKSEMSDSSSASSNSSSSNTSSSRSSSSKSKSSDSSSSESEESPSSSENESRRKAKVDGKEHKKTDINDTKESNQPKERHSGGDAEIRSRGKDEVSDKNSASSMNRRSIKDRLGERQPDKGRGTSYRSSGSREVRGERNRGERNRDERNRERERERERRLRRRRNSVDVKSNHSTGTHSNSKVLDRVERGNRSREGRKEDLREGLRHDRRSRDLPKPQGHFRTSDHSSDRREQNRHSLKDRDGRSRPDSKSKLTRSSRLRDKYDSNSKNSNVDSLRSQHSKDRSAIKSGMVLPKAGAKDIHSKQSDAESLSDIPLESEEEKGDSDTEDVRFRKGRHENSGKKQETEESKSQSRIVMSLTLPTDSEMQKADEEQRKDFKRRRTIEETRERNRSRLSSRDRSRRDRPSGEEHSKGPVRKDIRSPNEKARTLVLGRRRPRPSDFVSESESEDDTARNGLRSLVSGSGDTKKSSKDVSDVKHRGDDRRNSSRNNRTSPDAKGRADKDRKRERRDRREKKSRRLVITEEASGSSNKDQENGEDIVQKLSIRSRLGDRPAAPVRSSIKSRLGPKVPSPENVLDTLELPALDHRPKMRKIELSFENSDMQENHSEGKPDPEKRGASSKDTPVTKPDDLRHKMRRKLTHSSKGSGDQEGASPERGSLKRKVVKNHVWAEVLKERSDKEERGDATSASRQRSREREVKEERKKKTKGERKTKDDKGLEEKIKRMHEMNAAIMEKHKQIQKEKELFDC